MNIVFLLLGSLLCSLLRQNESLIFRWLTGFAFFLAIFAVVDIPIEVAGAPFHVLVYVEAGVFLLIMGYCVYRCVRMENGRWKLQWKKWDALTVIFIVLILLQIWYGMNNQIYASSYDTSYYNGNAINALYTDAMYEYDPYTGNYVGKAVQWNDCYSMMLAFLARVFRMHPLVVVNRVFGVLEIIGTNLIMYELAYRLSEKKRSVAVSTAAICAVIGIMSWGQSEVPGYYLWARLAESKSMLANVYLPLVLLGIVLVVKQMDRKYNWLLLALFILAGVNMSMSGVFMIPVLTGAGLLPALLYRRKVRYFVYAALCVMPCILTGAIRFLQ